MKKSVYTLILYLISLPAGLMLGLQIATVNKQYEKNKENFANDVKEAITQVNQVYSIWNSHTSTTEDAASYHSLYSNADSTFQVLIAQSAQPYPLLDFKPDTVLPKIRQTQFLEFRKKLEATRRSENPRLREFYVFRSIQYCTDCDEKQLSIAQIFPMDSLIRNKLIANEIETETEIAFFNTQKNKYSYLPAGIDSSLFQNSSFQYAVTSNEAIHLYFPKYKKAIRKSLSRTFISSLGLVLISLLCYSLAVWVLFQQKKLSEMKNDFINNVTHEFKTPIATINFALANIENDKVMQNPLAIRQFTEVIKDESKRLNEQVERVLQAAMLDKQALKLKKEEVDLHQLIVDLMSSYALKIDQDGKIIQELKATDFRVLGDKFHLTNAISNLLDNAIKYSPQQKEIHVETENIDQKLIIRIKDRGVGIKQDQHKLIFDKFYRVPTGNLHDIKGFGMGLSYVKAIVEAHEGEVHVSSQIKRGSIFTIILPLNSNS